ncbi:GFA family protein [Draconibacterium sp.]|nr:GFA family protein [Draconibacterium sp.]
MLKRVGDTAINPVHKSTCHCGAIELEIKLPDGIVDARRCNCSICLRKGAIVGSVPLSGLNIVSGEDKLRLYQFDTKEAEHYFCSTCGIYTHHRRRSNSNQYGINLGCLQGVDTALIEGVTIYDGADNHPSDKLTS